MDKKKVVGYARIGKEGVFTGCIGAQWQLINETVAKHPEWELIQIYGDEGTIGKKKRRRAFEEMLNDAEAHKFDIIIVKNIGRFSRDAVEAIGALKRLSDAGIEVFFIEDGLTSNDEQFKMQFTLICAIEEKQRELQQLRKKQKKD